MSYPKPNHSLNFAYYMNDTEKYGQNFLCNYQYNGVVKVPVVKVVNGVVKGIYFKDIDNTGWKKIQFPTANSMDYLGEVMPNVNTLLLENVNTAISQAGFTGDKWLLWEANWIDHLFESMRRAVAASKDVYWLVGIPLPGIHGCLHKILYFFQQDTSREMWNAIKYVDLADEPAWTKTQINGRINQMKTLWNKYGLTHKPLGITVADSQAATNGDYWKAALASNLNFISIEAYLTPPAPANQGDIPAITAKLTKKLEGLIAQVKARGKKVYLVMQGYDRNGCWQNEDSLKAVQKVCYDVAYNDPSVLGINVFNWSRGGPNKVGSKCKGNYLTMPYGWGSRPLGPQNAAPYVRTINQEHQAMFEAISG